MSHEDVLGQPNSAVEGRLGTHTVGAGRLSDVVVEKGSIGRWPSLYTHSSQLRLFLRLPQMPTHNSHSQPSSEDEGPPQSIIFGDHKLPEHPPTPNSPLQQTTNPFILEPDGPHRQPHQSTIYSPGPFREPSTSRSPSHSRSRSTSPANSPGHSTISALASQSGVTASAGLGMTGADTAAASSKPTFREVPVPLSPTALSRQTSKSPAKSPRMGKGEGYLDPTILSVASGSRNSGKGKERTRRKGGHKYHSLHVQDEEEEEPPESDALRTRGKVGLNAYEKALWKWVNVDDLDGFLQEVRPCAFEMKTYT